MSIQNSQFPLVSIITINYNQSAVTCQLLESLRKISYPNIEIFVIDNASPNDTPEKIKEAFPEIILIQSNENLGFAGGNNLCVRQASGKYLLFLNNDTEVAPGFLEPLVEKCESDLQIGAVSPKIKFYSKPDTIQFSGQAPINNFTMRSRGYGYGVVDSGQFDQDSLTNFVHGAAMMVPMSVIRKVGLMPECYFLYYEELDWCSSIKRAGYKLWYVHNSTILHKESMSIGKLTPFKTYYMNRARLLYLRRNVHGLSFFVAALYQTFVAIPKNMTVFLATGRTDHFKAYLNAVLWNFKTMFKRDIHINPTLE
ncbi:MAG: glycosyltransferase family 2 protein [Prolixibacteraceae bacterium]|nr:glycosyltransferase family 2 protein [Prolixibacteraceae bacterium]